MPSSSQGERIDQAIDLSMPSRPAELINAAKSRWVNQSRQAKVDPSAPSSPKGVLLAGPQLSARWGPSQGESINAVSSQEWRPDMQLSTTGLH